MTPDSMRRPLRLYPIAALLLSLGLAPAVQAKGDAVTVGVATVTSDDPVLAALMAEAIDTVAEEDYAAVKRVTARVSGAVTFWKVTGRVRGTVTCDGRSREAQASTSDGGRLVVVSSRRGLARALARDFMDDAGCDPWTGE